MNLTEPNPNRRLRQIGSATQAVAGMGLIMLLDVLTGSEVSFSLFYLLPIAWACWHHGHRGGVLAAGQRS